MKVEYTNITYVPGLRTYSEPCYCIDNNGCFHPVQCSSTEQPRANVSLYIIIKHKVLAGHFFALSGRRSVVKPTHAQEKSELRKRADGFSYRDVFVSVGQLCNYGRAWTLRRANYTLLPPTCFFAPEGLSEEGWRRLWSNYTGGTCVSIGPTPEIKIKSLIQ